MVVDRVKQDRIGEDLGLESSVLCVHSLPSIRQVYSTVYGYRLELRIKAKVRAINRARIMAKLG